MKVIKVEKSNDGITKKLLIEFDDKNTSEVVIVNREKKTIICIPTQIGCPIQCNICDAGKFIRNITLHEFILMENLSEEYIDNLKKPILISAMGVGEPTLNKYYCDYVSYNSHNRKMAFSTLVPDISTFERLIEHVKRRKDLFKIQFSLHSTNQIIRRRIFGDNIVKFYNIKKAIKILRKNNFDINNIELNYTLIDRFNDKKADAMGLALYFGEYKIKLNRFNKTKINYLEPSKKYNRIEFKNILNKMEVEYEEYSTDGQDIKAACGQMTSGLK